MSEESWIEVSVRGSSTNATVYLRGGSVSSVRAVASRRAVEDVAAQYGVPRSDITYGDGVFDEPSLAS